jgi:GNAT superfamily N-acetyltransferase
MTPADLPSVVAIGERVHPDHPEDPGIFAERLRLFSPGCQVLVRPEGLMAEGLVGYIIGHPWIRRAPPKLDTLLRQLPVAPDTFYIHDLALLPEARRRGHAAPAIDRMMQVARGLGLTTLSLVAVGTSSAFWGRHGFVACADESVRQGLASYGGAACFMVRAI